MQRLMLTPDIRFALRVGVPFTLSLLAGTIYMADEERRGTVVQARLIRSVTGRTSRRIGCASRDYKS